eukprot:9919560-Alexandrium_andersonii.AAC.1
MDKQEVARRAAAAKTHLEFTVKLYQSQAGEGCPFPPRAPSLGDLVAGSLRGAPAEHAERGEW